MKGVTQVRSNWLLAVILTLCLSACATIGGFNARALEHLTALKANHLKLIDSVVEAPAKAFDKKKFDDDVDKIDQKFGEAFEFAKTLDDRLRVSNIEQLKAILAEDARSIISKGRLLTEIEAKTHREPTAQAYDRAIKGGECARIGANCK